MNLIDKIKADSLTARKERDTLKINLLTTLYSEASRIGLDDGHRQTTDDEVVAVVKKFIKGIDQSIGFNKTGGIDIDNMEKEKSILENYLPKQMSESELESVISNTIADIQNANMGLVMKTLKEKYNGQYDSKLASEKLKKIFS